MGKVGTMGCFIALFIIGLGIVAYNMFKFATKG